MLTQRLLKSSSFAIHRISYIVESKKKKGISSLLLRATYSCPALKYIYASDVKKKTFIFHYSDIGYVCMIFHKRDEHVIEVQQSSKQQFC